MRSSPVLPRTPATTPGHSSSRRLPALLLLSLAAGTMSGCLINARSSSSIQGNYVSPEARSKIIPGQTREDFVMAMLGPPTMRTPLEDGTEIWRYTARKTSSGRGGVFLLLSTDSDMTRDVNTYVQFKDRVVQRTWQD